MIMIFRSSGMPADRVAVIDCGTNTIRLLVADPDGHGGLIDRDRRMEIVRLGQGVDATGQFHPDALQRTFAATERYAAAISELEVPQRRIRFVATSASRDVSNRDEFFAGIRQRLGVEPQVITGDEEARLSFTGALSGARAADRMPEDPVLVVDIGGGSTELIIGSGDGSLQQAVSLDIGSVRVTERFWTADPPGRDDLDRATEHIDRLLTDTAPDVSAVRTWIGVAGTLTTLAAIHLGLTEYDRSQVDGHRIPVADVAGLSERLAGSTVEQIRAIGSVHPQRADVITAGALIAARIAARVGTPELIVSEADILDGAALDVLATVDRAEEGTA
jgi:exopolyphosphatase/guanosine-5'-triphosphate,3'-diphosphate pyrophosphatase